MSFTLIVILIVLGIIFLLLEILVVPGTTFVGIIGFILMIVAIYFAYSQYGAAVGTYTLLGTGTIGALSLYFAFKSKTWKRAMLHTNIEAKVNTFAAGELKVGDTGKAISRLTPKGKAMFNNKFYEVQCQEGFLDEGSELIIIKISSSKIIVNLK